MFTVLLLMCSWLQQAGSIGMRGGGEEELVLMLA
jgi:hypothetical protein